MAHACSAPARAARTGAVTRRLLLGAPASLALAGRVRAARAEAAVLRVGEAVPQSFTFSLVDLGAKRGLFATEGLAIRSSAFGGPAKLQQALAADGVDIGLGVGLDLGFVAKGAPIKAIAAMSGPPLDTCILVLPNSPIKSAADLKGKKVGVTSLVSIVAWMVGEVAVRQGWARDAILQVPSGSTTASLALLKAGQLDATGSDIAPALQLAERREARVLLRFGDYVKDIHNNIIFATDTIAASRPNEMRAFLRGWFATIAFAAANRTETVADMTGLLGLDRHIVEQVYDLQMPMYSRDGRFDAGALAVLARALVETHMVGTAPDMRTLCTDAFLPPQ